MHLFPYIDSLWFGEGFSLLDHSKEYWLIEGSGIPFGLPNDLMSKVSAPCTCTFP